MYNRYVRNDDGRYERIPGPDPAPREGPAGPQPESPPPREAVRDAPPRPDPTPEPGGLLGRVLSRLHLETIDTGDLLLLVLLFLLFQDSEDEELLIALGLLLIL